MNATLAYARPAHTEGARQDAGPTSLRILLVTARYAPLVGGTETHVREVSRRMAERGHEVAVLTTDTQGTLPPHEVEHNVVIRRVRAYPRGGDLYIAPDLLRVISQGRWDIVHCQGYSTGVAPLAMFAAHRARLPYVLTFHSGGHSSPLRNRIRGLQRQLLRPLLARASRLIGVSAFEADFFSQRLRLPRERFVIIPNGAQLPPRTASLAPRPEEGPLIVASGRLEQYKGHQRLIAALPAIRAACPQVRLRIAGSGPYESELRRLTTALGLEGAVEIGGIPATDRAAMADLLAGASLVALLSDYEAHPIAVIEAVALGRPVLVTRTSGLGELVDRGLAHGIPLASTTDQVAEAIIAQLRSPFQPAPVVLPTWEDCTDQLLQLYSTVTHRAVVATKAVG